MGMPLANSFSNAFKNLRGNDFVKGIAFPFEPFRKFLRIKPLIVVAGVVCQSFWEVLKFFFSAPTVLLVIFFVIILAILFVETS